MLLCLNLGQPNADSGTFCALPGTNEKNVCIESGL
jgi:hypothetical protein